MIAERGESAIRLRDLTERAETNLAAVHYHFGGLGTLLAAATCEAVERIVDAQISDLDALPDDADLRQVAAAYFRPMVQAVSGPSSLGRQYVQVLSRVAADPPEGLEQWAADATSRAHRALLARLGPLLPGVPEDQLLFRIKCIGGILVLVSNRVFAGDIDGRSADEVELLFAPVVAGALLTA